MRRKFVLGDLAVLHDETNALELGYVRDWISRNGDEIREFPGSTAPT